MKALFPLMLLASVAVAQNYDRDTPAYLQNAPMRADSILATRAGPDIAVGYGRYVYNEPGVIDPESQHPPCDLGVHGFGGFWRFFCAG